MVNDENKVEDEPRSAVGVAALGVGVGVVLACVGCAQGPPDADVSSPAAAYVRSSPWGDGDGALLEGELRLDDECLVVGHDGQATVPVFPTDFVWDADAEKLSAFGLTFVVGDAVSLGGGYAAGPPSIAAHVPAGCPDTDYFLVSSAS